MSKKDKLPVWTDEQIEEASKYIIPLKCCVTVGVEKAGWAGPGSPPVEIRCGKDMHPGLGCREKFEWGGSHGFEGDPRKGMTFAEVAALPVSSVAAGLTLDDVDYKPHAVTDGGVGSGGSRRLDKRDSGVRRRVVLDGDASSAILRFLPDSFVLFYSSLVDRSYGERRLDASGSMAPPTGSPRVKAKKSSGRTSSSAVDKTLVATGGKRKNTAEIQFQDEKAVDFRRLIDRKLRRIARDIEEFLNSGKVIKSGKRRCSGKCGKIGEPDWLFCAKCGGRMEEVD